MAIRLCGSPWLQRRFSHVRRSSKSVNAAALDQASPEQRRQLADKMREEVKSAASGQNAASLAKLDDDALIDIMR